MNEKRVQRAVDTYAAVMAARQKLDKAERDDAQAWNYLTLEECNEVIKRLNGAYPG
jgi:hypothetical protein